MKKIAFVLLCAATQLTIADNIVRKDWNPKPMVEGNRRVDELIEWNKNHPGEMPPLTEEEKYEYFTKEGIPVPGKGAIVVSPKESIITNQHRSFVNKYNFMQKTKGYYEKYSIKASNLLSFPEVAEEDLEQHKLVPLKKSDTHLRETINSLPMSYVYKGVDRNLVQRVIGYAPEHTFVNGGWTGAVEFFVSHSGDVCAYHEVSIKLTQMAAYIPNEIATYKINNKVTTINVEGNKESGFVYNIQWWDKNFKRDLECATKEYSSSKMEPMIELAKKIDNY